MRSLLCEMFSLWIHAHLSLELKYFHFSRKKIYWLPGENLSDWLTLTFWLVTISSHLIYHISFRGQLFFPWRIMHTLVELKMYQLESKKQLSLRKRLAQGRLKRWILREEFSLICFNLLSESINYDLILLTLFQQSS